MTTELIIAVLGLIGTLLTGGCISAFYFRRANRRIKEAEAQKAAVEVDLAKVQTRMAELELQTKQRESDEERNSTLHNVIKELNATILDQAQSIKGFNKTIDDTKQRVRIVEDRLAETERENTRLAEENGELKVQLSQKRCELLDCEHREPPTDRTQAARKKKQQPKS